MQYYAANFYIWAPRENPNATVALIEFASRSLSVKIHPRKKTAIKKYSMVTNMLKNSLFVTVEVFFLLRFFFGLNFYKQTPSTYQTN